MLGCFGASELDAGRTREHPLREVVIRRDGGLGVVLVSVGIVDSGHGLTVGRPDGHSRPHTTTTGQQSLSDASHRRLNCMSQTLPPAISEPTDGHRVKGPGDLDLVGAMFASRSVPVHLARGLIGLVLVVVALAMASASAFWLLLVPLAVVLWRGCPTCWTMGLIATRAKNCPLR